MYFMILKTAWPGAQRSTAPRCAMHEFRWLLRTPTFYRAVVTAGERQLKLEWAQDSAFRFFPVQKDERCGYRLHDAAASNFASLTRHEGCVRGAWPTVSPCRNPGADHNG